MSKTIAIIGAGASGTLVCAQLLREPGASDRAIEWIGMQSPFGLGLAYGTRDLNHLLNVTARGMSAFPDEPLHFFRWLERSHPELKPRETDFAPRAFYGEYLQTLVSESDPRVRRHRDEAISVERSASGYRVGLKSGTAIQADEIVLALGNLQADASFDARFPRPDELAKVRREASVVLIGTGLTAIDTILSLRGCGHRGPISAISRRGLLPRVHAEARTHSPSAGFQELLHGPTPSLARALRIFRAEARRAEKTGSDWRALFDLIRPMTTRLWSLLSERQKRQFLRHLRPYWDVHRHRVAPGIWEKISNERTQGSLQIRSARILAHRKDGNRSIFRFRERTGEEADCSFDFSFDCTGLIGSLASAHSPLLKSLLKTGLVLLTEPAIGIAPAPGNPGLHVIGPLLRGSHWESVAVPEIRLQAEEITRSVR